MHKILFFIQALITFMTDDSLIYILFFREMKTKFHVNHLLGRRFTGTVVLFSLKTKKISFRQSSATNMLSAVRVQIY